METAGCLSRWIQMGSPLERSDQSEYGGERLTAVRQQGQVGEKFEPFLGKGWTYEPPAQSLLDRLQRVKMFYDSRGHEIRTVNPDGSEQRASMAFPTIDERDPTS